VWSKIVRATLAALILFLLAYILVRGYLQWTDPDRKYKLINFCAAWFPFAVSVFAAFIPDFEKAERMRPVWRIGIIVLGLVYSVILWDQQSVNISAARHDQEETIRKSSDHADQKFNELQQHLDSETSKSTSQIKGVKDGLSDLMDKMQSNLGQRIGEVGKPEPPELAKVEFSLWVDKEADFPKLMGSIDPELDGTFRVYWTAKNTSGVIAEDLELWILICRDCAYTKEPEGFDRPQGMDEFTRHKVWGSLNPGIATPKMETSLSLNQPYELFQLGFKYSCKSCGKSASKTHQLGLKVNYPLIPTFHFHQPTHN